MLYSEAVAEAIRKQPLPEGEKMRRLNQWFGAVDSLAHTEAVALAGRLGRAEPLLGLGPAAHP